MAQSHKGPKKEGKQDIKKSNDYGARDMFAEATSPPSVKKMLGKRGEFARYKHDDN